MSNFPTLDGLNNIEADSGNLTNITCETFIATSSAQAPTMTTGDISDHIATTAFVDDAITNAPFVTLDTTQTLTTGTKFFTNLPECSTLSTTGNQLTNKTYVDNAVSGVGGSAVLLAGNQTLTTGVKTFTNLPESSATPTTANQLVPKTYVDSNFVNLTGTQTGISGNKTFTGNNTFNCATGTNIIKGNQVDIFPTITYLTSPTTSVAGTNFNMNSTTNYISGTITYLASPTIVVNSTCNSFYVDASYSNFVGDNTLLQSPYTAITAAVSSFVNDSLSTIINSPYMAITSACSSLNLNATNTTITGNTNMTGSVVTATTQLATDNSTKIATTAFVNNYATANYMTLTSNQNVSGVKTYSTQQIFNAGLTSNNIYASGTTDMSLGSNMGNGILNIDSSKIVCDTFGTRLINLNTQLNAGCFIQVNPSLAVGETPSINFPADQVANFTNFVGASGTGEATKQINIGILKFWCGNNQSSVFSLTHSLTNGYAIGPGAWEEQIITFSFVDANTGITRYTTANLATTGVFSMPSLGTVVRPTITFTLTTDTLPQAVYNIFVYVKIVNAFINQALNTMTWNLSASPSTLTTTQNYNTPVDYTFTSRNLYHNFRNYVAGVYIINNIAVAQNIMLPIFYSVTDLTNIMSQPTTTGAVPTTDGGAYSGQVGVGNYNVLGCDNKDNYWLVYPNYGLIVYNSAGWTGTIYLNYRNKTSNPVVVAGTTIQGATSVKVYFDSVELIKY